MKSRQIEELYKKNYLAKGPEQATIFMFQMMQEQINDLNKSLVECAQAMNSLANTMTNQQNALLGMQDAVDKITNKAHEELGPNTQDLN